MSSIVANSTGLSEPLHTPLASPLQRITRTIAAGDFYNFATDSEFFYFLESSYGLTVSFNNGPDIPFSVALGYRISKAEIDRGLFIKIITIKNPLTVPLTFDLVIGRGELIDQRLNVLENRNGSAASLIPNDVAVVVGDVSIPSGGFSIIPANPNRYSVSFNLVSDSGDDFAEGDVITIKNEGLEFDLKTIMVMSALNMPANVMYAEYGNVIFVNVAFMNAFLAPITITIDNYSGSLSIVNNSLIDVRLNVSEKVYA